MSVARLKICRGGAGETPRYETHDVPFESGQSVLDGNLYRWQRPLDIRRYQTLKGCVRPWRRTT